jgi:hypothetical protein
MPGRPDQSIDVITTPVDDLVQQGLQPLLRVGNHLVVFHLLQQFFHGASVYLHHVISFSMKALRPSPVMGSSSTMRIRQDRLIFTSSVDDRKISLVSHFCNMSTVILRQKSWAAAPVRPMPGGRATRNFTKTAVAVRWASPTIYFFSSEPVPGTFDGRCGK